VNRSDGAQRKTRADALATAEAEVAAALAILFDRRCRPSQSGVHIVRGWQALARLTTEESPAEGTTSRWMAMLDARDLGFSSPGERVAWEKAIVDLAAGSMIGAVAGAATAPSRRDLLAHVRRLERALRRASSRLRIATPSKRRRRIALGVAVVVIGAAVGAYRVYGLPSGGPWLGRYYPNIDLVGEPTLRRERDVFFDWGDDPPFAPLPADDFSAAWDTCLRVAEKQKLRFVLGSDDGSRLAIDGKRVIDNWGPHDFRIAEGEAELAAGTHLVTVEFFDKAGAARVALRVAQVGGALEPLPAGDLSAPRRGPDGTTFCPGDR